MSERQRRMSIIEEGPEPQVRMAYLAIVGSFSVNGVAALHSQLLTEGLFRDFYELWPEKFNNKTNGVTPRRWLAWCNPALATLITETIGDGWVADLQQLRATGAAMPTNAGFPPALARGQAGEQGAAGRAGDRRVRRRFPADGALRRAGQADSRVQAPAAQRPPCHPSLRPHQARRYWPTGPPRCVLIGGKAAPGYSMAKLIIKLINNVAQVVNARSAACGDRLKVAFFPDYRVTAMEVIAPGTDLSEQISTAGKEASGTGNMKFMMNGAVTIGTLDGANIEIREEVGAENFFLFGLTAERGGGRTRGTTIRRRSSPATRICGGSCSCCECGHFNQFEPGIFDPHHRVPSPAPTIPG